MGCMLHVEGICAILGLCRSEDNFVELSPFFPLTFMCVLRGNSGQQ